MVRRLSLSFIALLPFLLKGQQSYFSRRYDFNHSPENGFNIVLQDSGYAMWCSSTLDPLDTSYRKIIFCALDSSGNLLQTKIYGNSLGDNYCGGEGKICKISDGGYALAGSISYTAQDANVILYKFNYSGDSLWAKEYGDTSFQSGWQCKQTRDGGFIITGQTTTYDYYGDVLLIKTDSNGIMQWQKHYGGTYQDIGFSVDTCFDGGFIIGGFTWSYGVNTPSSFANGYLIKTDSLGNFEWQQVFGGSYDDRFWQVIQSPDSSFYGVGFYTKWDPFAVCCASRSVPYIVNLHQNGSLNWERIYGDSVYDLVILNAKIANNGDLICSGYSVDSVSGYSYQGVLLRVSSHGDSLLYKGYRGLSGTYSSSYFYDSRQTSDKGYICIGYVTPAAPDTGSQDIWVLKLDSNGCDVANCLGLAANNILSNKNQVLQIFPNPFTTSTTLVIDAPEVGFSEIIISDYLGSTIKKIHLSNGHNKIEFSDKNLRPGIYFETLYHDQMIIASKQLIKMN